MRVLVVEDSPTQGMVVQDYLARAYPNSSVHWMKDGSNVVSTLKSSHFDLVLLDIHLPGLSGLEILEEVGAAGLCRYTPMLVITGLREDDLVEKCFELGVRDYLEKPLRFHDFKARVKNSIAACSLEQGLQYRVDQLERYANMGLLFKKSIENLGESIFELQGINTIQNVVRKNMAHFGGDTGRLEKLMNSNDKHLSQITNALMELSTFNPHEMDQIQTVDSRELLEPVISTLNCRGFLNEIALSVQYEGQKAINTSPFRVHRMLINLITNSVEALRGVKNPWISVKVRGDSGSVTFSVEDNGVGYPDWLKDRMYEPMISHGKGNESLGLGLFIVKSALDSMCGKIQSHSEIDIGTAFEISVPQMA